MPTGGDVTIAAVAPPEQEVIGGDYTIAAVEPDAAKLEAYYPLNGDTLDASGNGRDGTAVGGTYVAGADGQGMLFSPDPGDDYVNCGTWNPSEATGQLGVSIWLNWNGVSGQYMGLIGKRDTWAEDEMMWHVEATQSDGNVNIARNNGDWLYGYGIPQQGEWEHLAFSFDGTTGTVYRDGEPVGSAAWSLGPDTEALLVFGCCDGLGNNPFNGALDEVRLYNSALTEGEVRHLAGVGDKYVPPEYGPCRLSLEFEGDLTDSSGNNNHGTAVGDITFEDDPVRGQVVVLPGGDNQFVDCGDVGLSGNDPTTIVCWAKAKQHNIPNWSLIFGFTGTVDGGGGCGSHFNFGSIGGPEGSGAHSWCWEESMFSDQEAMEWHHYAMTYDGTKIEYYGDGKYIDSDFSKTNVRDLSIRADRVYLGSRITHTNSWPGKVDDARVYDYVLSQGEILYVSGIGDMYVPTKYGPMLAHYDFEGDATDKSGNGYDGTLVGDAAIVDGVLQLDGDGDCVNLGADNAFNFPGSFSISAWVNMHGWGGSWGNAIIGKRGESGDGWQLRRRGGNQRLTFTIRGTPGGDDPTGSIEPPLNEWIHVAAVFDVENGARTVYQNGEVDLSIGDGGSVAGCMHDVYIGGRANGGNTGPEAFFDGDIDDIAIYDYALTQGQVAGLAGKTADNPISDTWSDVGMIDFSLVGGAMKMNTYALPGLPYYVGEVGRALPFADLTAGGGKAISAWVRGDPANIAAIMYMSVADADGQSADVAYDGDLTDGDWQEWNVDMAALAGVDVSNAADIAIGLAGLDGGVVADAMSVDNIRVYTSRCMPEIVKPVADLNGDCVVDAGDLMVLAGWWDYVPGAAGVWYEYYPEPPWIFGNDIQNAPFDTTTPAKTGVVNNFDIGIREQNDRFGFLFTGMIDLPEDGDYTFYTSSDDGSFLDIDDVRVVQNYGWHGMQWREGTIALTAGKHKIAVAMFEDGGGEGLETEYAGPGIDRQPIPDDVLSLGPIPAEIDLSGDGDIGWMDVILMLGDWLDEELWP
jgi:hypothetical protein